MDRTAPLPATLAAALTLLLYGAAQARDLDQDEALRLRQDGVIQPLQQLMQQILQRHNGARLLEADLEEDDGLYFYEIELLTRGGQVHELEIDASSGRLLKDEEGD